MPRKLCPLPFVLCLLSSVLCPLPCPAQPLLRGPLTTNSPAIKPALTDGLLDARTNNLFRVPVGVSTNLVITNLAVGQVIRIDLFVTNGFTVTFSQQTAANTAQGWLVPVQSNAWQTVIVSQPAAGETNFDVRAAQFLPTAGLTMSLDTNFATRAVTIRGATLSSNGVTVGAFSNLNVVATGGTNTLLQIGVTNGNATLQINGTSAGGEANVNGEVSLTNSTLFGLVNGKAGVTNLLRSIAARNGLLGTNEGGTNISLAIDPAIVASQLNLTNKVENRAGSATNLTAQGLTVGTNLLLQTATASRVAIFDASKQLTNSAAVDTTELEFLDGVSSAIQTQFASATNNDATSSNNLRTIIVNVATNKVENLNGAATNLAVYQTGSAVALTVQPLIGSATNTMQTLDTNGVPFVFTTSNKVFTISPQGTVMAPTPGSSMHVAGSNGTPLRVTFETYNSASTFGTLIHGRRNRGTPTSPSAVTTNDVLLDLSGAGYGGTSNSMSQSIFAQKGAGTWTDLSRPTFMQWHTTPTNSTTTSNRMELQHWGLLNNFAGTAVRQITGTTDDVWRAEATNGTAVWLADSNVTLTAMQRTGFATDLLTAKATNGNTTFGLNSNGIAYAQPSTGATNDYFQFRTTNGVTIGGVRSNQTLWVTNVVQTPPELSGANGGNEVGVAYRLFSLTNSVTVTNTTSATSLITNALWGSQVIKAGTLKPGMNVRLRLRGIMTSASATVTTMGLRLNNSQMAATNIIALPTTLVNDHTGLEIVLSVRSSGASGVCVAFGEWYYQTTTGAANAAAGRRLQNAQPAGTITVDTTVDQVIDLFVTPGATTHGFTVIQALGEIIP